jgi:hypothetical protein
MAWNCDYVPKIMIIKTKFQMHANRLVSLSIYVKHALIIARFMTVTSAYPMDSCDQN